MNVNISIRTERHIHPQWTRTFTYATIREPYRKRLALAGWLILVIVGLVFNICGDEVNVLLGEDLKEVES